MGRLCYGTYAKLLQTTLAKNSNVDVTELLLGLITDNEDITNQLGDPFVVTDKYASDLLGCKDNIRKKIKVASGTQKIMNAAKDYFEDVVIPEIMPDMVADLIAGLRKLISSDDDIPKRKQSEFLSMGNDDTLADFLSGVFLYAIKKPNKLVTDGSTIEVSTESTPLLPQAKMIPESLMETNSICPSCGKPLVGDKNSKSLAGYRITHIIPSLPSEEQKTELNELFDSLANRETFNNKIALCLECSNRYSSHTTRDDCIKMLETKDRLHRNFATFEILDKMYLEEQIEEVLRQIPTASQKQLSDTLSYSALRVKEKISENNVPLIIKTEGYVVPYYNYIRSVFSQLEREGKLIFDDVANDVQRSYRKLHSSGLTQDEIYTQLVDWFKNKTNAQNMLACEIIVAFFVQNCEVFHALTQ